MLNWEGYMSTYSQLKDNIQFCKPAPIVEIDRMQVWRNFRQNKPNAEALARAIGGLSAYVTSFVLRNCLESAIYPGRMDFDSCLREAYRMVEPHGDR